MAATARSEESIFAEALDKASPAERAAFVDAACGEDIGLRARVRDLLKSHSGAGSFLRDPLGATLNHPLTEGPGTVIGPYKLLQQIGEGGMGVVYMADQESPVRRRVALKIIKPGMDSGAVIARFEAERQALAMMDHQNIARVLDAGTTDSGRPFFVMELVHGVPITTFCNDNRLTLRQRLELFIPVCQAIQHAHQKGVIHRDIKPGNILVTMYDDKPVPKVIDFGVAKAVEQRLTERTLFTQYGTLVGTFEYMSPEQAEMNALGVDTRSDVYSLGVLLYELLTGTTPLDRQRLRESALQELLRMIKEEEPQRPSVRLSTSESLPKVAAAFRVEPAQLSQLLRGELDWIVMKCLEKDRTRRYETANGLARDVQRHLADEQVEACPPTAGYRLRKLARKHWPLLSTAAIVFVALSVAVVGTTYGLWEAQLQRDVARDAQAAAEVARAAEARERGIAQAMAAAQVQSAREAVAALERERIARQEAEAAKELAEWHATRLSTATQLANEGIENYYGKNRAAALDRFARAAEIEPDLNTIYCYRRMMYTTLGLWDLAAADYAQSIRLSSRADAQTLYQHALLRLHVGDEQGYREACQEIIRQHGRSENNDTQLHIVRTCYQLPNPAESPADLAQRAEHLLALNDHPWVRSAAGFAHLRAANYELAATRCREVIDAGSGSPGGIHRANFFALAIALHHQGHSDEARDALDQGESAIDEWTSTMLAMPQDMMPISWTAWLECLHFRREATLLITGAEPADDPRWAVRRDRGLAEISFGDAFSDIEAAREHVARGRWDDAAASFAQALVQLPDEVGSTTSATALCLEALQRPEVFDALLELRPEDPRLWFAHGRAAIRQRDWAAARADFAKVREFSPDVRAGARAATTFELATLYLLSGDPDGYLELRQEILNDPTAFENPFIAGLWSRLCTLRGGQVADWSVPIRLADSALAKSHDAWFQFAAGIAHYRAGNDEEAVRFAWESLRVQPKWKGRAQNYLVLAMACHRLGRADEAKDWLAQARSGLDEMNQTVGSDDFDISMSSYSTDWLTTLVLLPEAESIVAKGQP